MPKILIMNSENKYLDVHFMLLRSNCHIERCENIDELINRYLLFQNLENGFDLVLIFGDIEWNAKLGQVKSHDFLNKLIIVQEKKLRSQNKKPFGNYTVCTPELALDCIRYHLKDDIAECNPQPAFLLH